MADEGAITLRKRHTLAESKMSPFSIKVAEVHIMRGGAIIEVVNQEQAQIAESAGACAVIAAEPLNQGIQRMADPSLVKEIKRAVSIPVIGKVRVGHFVEAQILESIGVDYIEESESLAVADEENHINKNEFRRPFICGSKDLGEAFRRIREGAAMIRIQGEKASGGDIVDTIHTLRSIMANLRILANIGDDEISSFSTNISAPYDVVVQTKQMGRMPVLQFAAGGIATPADVSLLMQLGCDGVIVGSEIFCCSEPYKCVKAMVDAVMNYNDAHALSDAMTDYFESQ